jgi:hypothetical protein
MGDDWHIQIKGDSLNMEDEWWKKYPGSERI